MGVVTNSCKIVVRITEVKKNTLGSPGTKRKYDKIINNSSVRCKCQSQWPRGLKRRSMAARLLRSWVRIPPGAWMFVYCECCVLLGRGLCDELITRPEESYRLWCVVVCDLETTKKFLVNDE